MTIATTIAAIEARGRSAATAAIARSGDTLATLAAAELPGVLVTRDDTGVRLTAPGLRARAFGTQHLLADPRVAGLIALLSRLGQ